MNDQRETDLEAKIQSLLCNDLDEDERDALLKRIATDECARTALMNLLTCRQQVREAYGYDGVESAIRASFAKFSKTLQGGSASVDRRGTGPEPEAVRIHGRHWKAFIWPLLTAAAALVAVYLGVTRHPGTIIVSSGAAGSAQKVAATQLTPHELAMYRRIWDEIVLPSGGEAAWILLDKDSGRFEFIPDGKTGEAPRPAVLRCRIQSTEGETLGSMDLLLTLGKPLKIVLGQTGELAGEPVRYSVTGEGDSIAVTVLIGKDEASSVGVQGKVQVNREMADVGCVRLDKRDLRVLLQAVTLHGGAS